MVLRFWTPPSPQTSTASLTTSPPTRNRDSSDRLSHRGRSHRQVTQMKITLDLLLTSFHISSANDPDHQDPGSMWGVDLQ